MNKNSKMYNKCFRLLCVVVISVFQFQTLGFSQMESATVAAPQTVEASPVVEEIKKTLPGFGNVTVNFKEVDILTVLRYLSEVSAIDIVPSPGVEGSVTMRLRNKPWEVALDIVTRNYGYAYSREGDIIRVIPKGQLNAETPITEVILLNHIIQDIELIRAEDTESASGNVEVEEKKDSLNELISAINTILDKKRGENATYISGSNALVITAIPSRINSIRKMIEKLDKKTPQILLDAKVIEIQLDKDERLGVDWNAIISASGARRPISFPFTNSGVLPFLPSEQRKFMPNTTYDGVTMTGGSDFPIVDAFSDTGQMINPTTYTSEANTENLFSYGTLDFSTFSATLAMIDQRDGSEILSCPRITTLNNQKATIKVVDKIMLQKTQQTTQTAGIVTVEFETEDEAREVGVKLTIMPHVNANGEIIVNLMPEVSTNSGFDLLSVGTSTTATLSLTFNSREANTRVRVNDGETIFIGGLIRETVTTEESKLPFFGDILGGIPFLGRAFKYNSDNTVKTEIVFFVTVHLLKDDNKSSFEKSGTVEFLEYYGNVTDENMLANKEPKERPLDPNIVKQGKMKNKEEEIIIEVETENKNDKKEKKPFFDFRKKQKSITE